MNNLLSRKVPSGKDGVAHDFVGHKSPDSHHSGTSIVQLNRALLEFHLIAQFVPSEVKDSVTVITDELGLIVQPVSITVDDLGNHEEGSHLQQDVGSVLAVQKCLPGGEAIGDVLGSGEADSGGGGQVSGDGKHGDAAVLDLLFAEVVEGFLVAFGQQSEGIEESKL